MLQNGILHFVFYVKSFVRNRFGKLEFISKREPDFSERKRLFLMVF